MARLRSYFPIAQFQECRTNIECITPPLPATAGIELEWESVKNECALLISDPIKYDGHAADGPFRKWIAKHGTDTIKDMNLRDQIKTYGPFLVTKVYCTRRCSVITQLGEGLH